VTTTEAEHLRDIPAPEGPSAGSRQRFRRIFGSTFVTIFLAELGDKTQVTTLLMSAESHAPWVVFTGAAAALISTSLLGVLLGQWLARRVSPKVLDTAAAVLLLLIMVGLVADIVGVS
jgi:putative Ca2+/H+ antiporter (TMEM165/GDT1 family)